MFESIGFGWVMLAPSEKTGSKRSKPSVKKVTLHPPPHRPFTATRGRGAGCSTRSVITTSRAPVLTSKRSTTLQSLGRKDRARMLTGALAPVSERESGTINRWKRLVQSKYAGTEPRLSKKRHLL